MSVTSKSEVMEILSMPEEVFHREITPLARNVAKQQGFERVFLISGEDPKYGFDNILSIVSHLKKTNTNLKKNPKLIVCWMRKKCRVVLCVLVKQMCQS